MSNNIPCFFEEDRITILNLCILFIIAEIGIEYLRINIEDTSDVPIKLFFSVAYQYLENAFNECKLLSNSKSMRSNALVDDAIVSHADSMAKRQLILNSSALLTPIEVDFVNNVTERQKAKSEIISHEIG